MVFCLPRQKKKFYMIVRRLFRRGIEVWTGTQIAVWGKIPVSQSFIQVLLGKRLHSRERKVRRRRLSKFSGSPSRTFLTAYLEKLTFVEEPLVQVLSQALFFKTYYPEMFDLDDGTYNHPRCVIMCRLWSHISRKDGRLIMSWPYSLGWHTKIWKTAGDKSYPCWVCLSRCRRISSWSCSICHQLFSRENVTSSSFSLSVKARTFSSDFRYQIPVAGIICCEHALTTLTTVL